MGAVPALSLQNDHLVKNQEGGQDKQNNIDATEKIIKNQIQDFEFKYAGKKVIPRKFASAKHKLHERQKRSKSAKSAGIIFY